MKKGDRVVCIKEDSWIKVGMEGTYWGYLSAGSSDVQWDNTKKGHNGLDEENMNSKGHWYVDDTDFKLRTSSITYNYLIL